MDYISWDTLWLSMAVLAAMKSKDKHTKVGAVIVRGNDLVQIGFNSPPRKVEDRPDRFERPEKYTYISHAEENAVVNCARLGLSTIGTKMYTSQLPCHNCARTIIQAGIEEVILWNSAEVAAIMDDHDWPASREMFFEAGVTLRTCSAPIVKELFGWRKGTKLV